MNESLPQIAKELINHIRTQTKATNVTCHFYNGRSNVYWLFHKSGDFKYEELVHGPLTHPQQKARFTFRSGSEWAPGEIEIVEFDTIPPELHDNVLSGESFVDREEIKKAIRARLDHPFDPQIKIFIFLNYRESASFDVIRDKLLELRPLINSQLIPLSRNPRLDHIPAWKFRSYLLQFLTTLNAQSGAGDKDLQKLYDNVVDMGFDLIQPASNSAKTISCTLSLADAQGVIKVVAANPPGIITPSERGIVHHVGLTGQAIFIKDVAVYNELYNKNPGQRSRPKYVVRHPETQCEIAVPLIVHGKIVGVLNFEANEAGAYDDAEVLLGSQLAVAAAMTVRQATLRKDLWVVINHQRKLLADCHPECVFQATAKAVEDHFGHGAAIFDADTNRWYNSKGITDSPAPRLAGEGYTNWILQNGKPLALADIHKKKVGENENTPIFDFYEGQLHPDTKEFERWGDRTPPPMPISPRIASALDDENIHVITDLGFPIMSPPGAPRKVRAVLWAKYYRHFASLINDEPWSLSLLCQNATEALTVDSKLKIRDLPQKLLAYHFGDIRANAAFTVVKDDPKVLTARYTQDVVILHVDIRGSTCLGKDMAQNWSEQYVDFINAYHKLARKVIIDNGGVFDKSVGDGIIGLFPSRDSSTARVSWTTEFVQLKTAEEARLAAVQSAFGIFDRFQELVAATFDHMPFAPEVPPSLGAGLVAGPAYMGSLGAMPDMLEFSAYGDAANKAGKLVGKARRVELKAEMSEASYVMWALEVTAINRPKPVPVDSNEQSRVLKWLHVIGRSILLVEAPVMAPNMMKDYSFYATTRQQAVGGDLPYLVIQKKEINPTSTGQRKRDGPRRRS